MNKTIQQLDELISGLVSAVHEVTGDAGYRSASLGPLGEAASAIESLVNARAALIQPNPHAAGGTVLSGRLLMLGREVYDGDGERVDNANGDHRSVLAVVIVAPGEAAELLGHRVEDGGWHYLDRWATMAVHPER